MTPTLANLYQNASMDSGLTGIGFKALATTSSGHAWSIGQADGAVSRATTLAHMRALVEATALPVNADQPRNCCM